jgi:S1-C subfamily serine protease
LQRGDVITAVNSIRVGSSLELVYQLQSNKHEKLELELDVCRLERRFIHKRIFLKRELTAVKDSGS